MEVIDLDELFKNEDSSEINSPDNKVKKNLPDKNGNGRNLFKIIFWYVRYIIIITLGTLFVVTFICQRSEVRGSSMETTLSDGDNLIIDKLSYRISKPERFDIVIFPHEDEGNKVYYIKRIIGLPGEQIQIFDGVIYIDDVPLREDYGCEVIQDAKLAASPIVLGDDEYFVLGDNRNNSSDSREIGPVNGEIIIGKAVFRIWPVKGFGVLR